jgi:hypothetical protein
VFRLLGTLILLGLVVVGGWWTWTHVPAVRNFVERHIDRGEFLTLESRFSSDQVMEQHRSALLTDAEHVFRRPEMLFFPYALMEVKYSDSKKSTREGLILWSLTDGEMVIDTATWEKTHGFQDCLDASATRSDYKVINALAQTGDSLDPDTLASLLYVQSDLLDQWLESCRRKKLVVPTGSGYRLHFQNPRLQVNPETHITQALVTRSLKQGGHLKPIYSVGQVERGAANAFGRDFVVRRTRLVYLPVHRITVQNPDGTVHTTDWNALNGKRIETDFF